LADFTESGSEFIQHAIADEILSTLTDFARLPPTDNRLRLCLKVLLQVSNSRIRHLLDIKRRRNERIADAPEVKIAERGLIPVLEVIVAKESTFCDHCRAHALGLLNNMASNAENLTRMTESSVLQHVLENTDDASSVSAINAEAASSEIIMQQLTNCAIRALNFLSLRQLLQHNTPEGKREVLKALRRVAESGERAEELVGAGLVRLLVDVVRTTDGRWESGGAGEDAICTLAQLAAVEACRAELVEVDVLKLLISVLWNEKAPVSLKEYLLTILAAICTTPGSRQAVMDQNGLYPICDSLRDGTDRMKEGATALVHMLSQDGEHRASILRSGAVSALVNMVRCDACVCRPVAHAPAMSSLQVKASTKGCILNALRALVCLVDTNQENARYIIEKGAARPVLAILRNECSDLCGHASQMIGGIAAFAHLHSAWTDAASVETILEHLSTCSNPICELQLCGALDHLSANGTNLAAMSELSTLALLCKWAEGKEYSDARRTAASHAIECLNRHAVAASTISILQMLLQHNTPEGKREVLKALRRVAESGERAEELVGAGLVQLLVDVVRTTDGRWESGGAGEDAICTLAQLAAVEACRAELVEGDAIGLLISVLRSALGAARSQEGALRTIRQIVMWTRDVKLMLEPDVLRLLSDLLVADSSSAHSDATVLLATVSLLEPSCRPQICKSDAHIRMIELVRIIALLLHFLLDALDFALTEWVCSWHEALRSSVNTAPMRSETLPLTARRL
jgi:hypothetical protein